MSTITRTLLFLLTSLLLLVSIFSFASIPHFSSIGGLLAESTGWPFIKHVVDQVNAANHHVHQPSELRWPRARAHHPRNWIDVSIRSYPCRRVDEKDVAVLTASNFTDFVARNQEMDVVVLTNQNFNDVISRNRYVMVNFYASWCYWSKQLAPVYAATATMLKGEVVLAKVEASVEKELAKQYHIQGYPQWGMLGSMFGGLD